MQSELERAVADFAECRQAIDTFSAATDFRAHLQASIELAFKMAIVLALRQGVTLPPARNMTGFVAEAMRTSCCDHLAANDENGEVEIARDTFGSLAALWLGLERYLPGARPRIAVIGGLYFDLGIKFAHLGHFIDGVWADYAKTADTRARLSDAGKKRKTAWLEKFEPVLRAHCLGKTKVTRGRIIGLAKTWAAKYQGADPPKLPKDEGIWKGVLRLEAAGLVIPGRRKQSINASF